MYNPNYMPVPFRLGLYPVVDNFKWIKSLLEVGVRTIQLRSKNMLNKTLEYNIIKANELSRYYNARLFINDYWQLAIKHRVYGVHLGQEDLKYADLKAISAAGLRLGISTHNYMEINVALSVRPSYISLGHIFPTKTKNMSSAPQGVKQLALNISRLYNYPTVSIGGISIERVPTVLKTGVGSIAVVSAITQASNWKIATAQLLELVGAGDE